MAVQTTHTLVIGASFSGLASAASLQRHGIEYIVIEKQDRIATPWRQHYDRLHLHTHKRISGLPFKKFGKGSPLYPSRRQVIDYLERYQSTFDIRPVFGTEAISIERQEETWITRTNRDIFLSKYLIMATGPFGRPRMPKLPGMDSFPGEFIHSARYRNATAYTGQRVLLIGFGNSACEIAIDLVEQKATPFMSVRSAVNIIPRDILGIPVLAFSLLMQRLPPRLADRISAPLIQLVIGDLAGTGREKKPYGPLEQIHREGKAPVLDTGTLRLIRQKRIGILPGISHIQGSNIYFMDGSVHVFDAIIACTGYYNGLDGLLQIDAARFDDLRHPVGRQQHFGKDGLYFCGFYVSPTGQIREIAGDAQKIAADIAKKERFRTNFEDRR